MSSEYALKLSSEEKTASEIQNREWYLGVKKVHRKRHFKVQGDCDFRMYDVCL